MLVTSSENCGLSSGFSFQHCNMTEYLLEANEKVAVTNTVSFDHIFFTTIAIDEITEAHVAGHGCQ